MTGKHMGHASVRANDGGTSLRAEEQTIASILKPLGYATGGFGKWGCGGRDSTGVPEEHGFDVFFGYYDQVHAHSFYPPYLIRNSEEVILAGNKGGRSGETYSHYAIMDEALKFIRDQDQPRGNIPALHGQQLTHGFFIVRITAQAKHGFGGVCNEPACPEAVSRLGDGQ